MNARIVVSARGVRYRPSLARLASAPLLAVALACAVPVSAQQAPQAQADPSRLSVERIYAGTEFRPQPFGPARWLAGGAAYATLERAANGRGRDIVRYDAETGAREVLVPATQLTPPGDTVPLAIDDYAWSADETKLLVFTNSQPVWRTNDRGDYWVLERASGRLRKLGGPQAKSATLLFAKFSPDGTRVGYVRERNLYVENLPTGAITRLTRDGSRTLVNGSFDWVYEEELGLHDGWRWSPDGRFIAYWQLDITGVRDYDLINDTDSLYSFAVPVQYPKAGETNSAGRVGVVSAAGGLTRWMQLPGDARENYIARMEWAPGVGGAPAELVVQHLNRLQNTLHVLLVDPRTGVARTALTEQDSTWVEVFAGLAFVNGGRDFVWQSERDGWSHLYLVARATGEARLLTPGAFDVIGYQGVDEAGGWMYFTASPDNAAQRYLYRVRLDGSGPMERVSPMGQPGSHSYNSAPLFRFALHSYSTFDTPPLTELVRLPQHQALRTLVENAQLRQRVAALRRGRSEFRAVDIGGGVSLDAWFIYPPDFDPSRRYPVFFSNYGGPGSQTVLDGWGGSGYLWNQMLAQRGYIIASVDNRGTGARGRAWRRIIYRQMGVIETQDQAAAARAVGRFPYVDSTRIGVYGHSYGGFMALNCILQYPDVYRTAIAAAPVTHWKYYDTIYTERYNGLPQDNTAGYDRGSPLTYARNLRGNLLIVHGSGDDNVHYQNTEVMVNALVRAQRQFSLMVYPNRNHGIGSDGAARHRFELYTRFLEERLPPGPAGPAAGTTP
jgi:dipeptidyl-peptidase-4